MNILDAFIKGTHGSKDQLKPSKNGIFCCFLYFGGRKKNELEDPPMETFFGYVPGGLMQ